MKQNIQGSQRYKLKSKIRDRYKKVTYTQSYSDKTISRSVNINNIVKVFETVLLEITIKGFITTISSKGERAIILGSIVSLILLMLNPCISKFNLVESIQKYKSASGELEKNTVLC